MSFTQDQVRWILDRLSPRAQGLALALARDVSGLGGLMFNHALIFVTIDAFWEDV